MRVYICFSSTCRHPLDCSCHSLSTTPHSLDSRKNRCSESWKDNIVSGALTDVGRDTCQLRRKAEQEYSLPGVRSKPLDHPSKSADGAGHECRCT